DLIPLWVAEPYLPLPDVVCEAISTRSSEGWYGYESRGDEPNREFWSWMARRHGWEEGDLHTVASPSVGTTIGSLIELFTDAGDGVLIQPPVFTDFKTLVGSADRLAIRNSLVLEDGGYSMDLSELESKAAEPSTKLMILCNPHNPIGRAWLPEELRSVADLCAAHEVFVVADEIHADLVLGPARFTPFAQAAEGTGVRWAAAHGPIKTFGLAGVADTVVIAPELIAQAFDSLSSRLHLSRNNVFSIAATKAAYRAGDTWLDDLADLIETNLELLRSSLTDRIQVMDQDATYLAWLDFRSLGLDVHQLARWLVEESGLALSPGHWFGREGAGFARMTIAAPTPLIEQAVHRLNQAARRST
ncbi:MAG: aminotransferase class I/II-fold pyridoxal phosphate-dependent enzyme, partial [Acidimicrobiia bacterium]|nr:aminotransferase class I/II-fold pyridoxal phosphate-dependent enzyme [Acidimicrobiia bacterium]